MSRKIGLIGYGYWGKNLARCFNELEVLVGICDPRFIEGDEMRMDLPGVKVFAHINDILAYPLDSMAIATPPETHYSIATQCLAAGKHVFIEKPMTTKLEEAKQLIELAEKKSLSLMVGHIYLHNGGIQSMPIPVGTADLYVTLLNEKGPPSKSTRDLMWAGLPHACSLAFHFFHDFPINIEVIDQTASRIQVILDYWNGSSAYIDVGDYTGYKFRAVELRISDTLFCFDAKYPNLCKIKSGGLGRLLGLDQELAAEPLMAECKAFLTYKGVDLMGIKVVDLIERIQHESNSQRGEF